MAHCMSCPVFTTAAFASQPNRKKCDQRPYQRFPASPICSKIKWRQSIRAHCGVVAVIKRTPITRWAYFATQIYVARVTTNAHRSLSPAKSTKDWKITVYSRDRIANAIRFSTIVWRKSIRWCPIKLATLISIYCDRNAFANNTASRAARNGEQTSRWFISRIICYRLSPLYLVSRSAKKCLVYIVDTAQSAKWQWFDNRLF